MNLQRVITRSFLVLLLLAFSSTARSIEVPDDIYNDILAAVKNLKTLEDAVPVLTLAPIIVVIDKDGNTFVPEKTKAHLEIGYLSFDLEVALSSAVQRAAPEVPQQCIFCNRYKASAFIDLTSESSDVRFGGAFVYEPIHYGVFGLNTYLGTTSSGAGVSVDLTKNFGMLAGAGVAYADQAIHPVLGIFFSFN